MTVSDDLCAHCRLPLARQIFRRRLCGEEQAFCCYGCALAFQVGHGFREEADAAWHLIRLGVGAFLAMNIMVLSLLLYSGTLSDEDMPLERAVHVLLLLLATPTVLILGLPFLRQSLEAVRLGQLTVDSLIVLGAGAAYGYSAWAVFAGLDHVYFDTATMVLVLFTLGRYLEAAGRARAMRDLEPLLAPERVKARVVHDDDEQLRPVAELSPGMAVRVLPGERIPVDGLVLEGNSSVNESLLTGESRPVAKQVGTSVLAGSTNTTGMLLIETTAVGSETRWAAIGRQVAGALRQKTPTQRLADQVAGHFIYAVLALAIATLLFWETQGDSDQALLNALAVLVVACPCALGLAAPLATSVGVGLALRRGALVRGGEVLERLARVRAVALDKTGTLTTGAIQLDRCEGIDGERTSAVLAMAAAVERDATHPLATAVVEAARTAEVPLIGAANVQTIPGGGVHGEQANERVAVGSKSFLETLGWIVPEAAVARARDLAGHSQSVAFVVWGDRARGILTFSDLLRSESVDVVRALRRCGLYTLLLSGDREQVVAASAASAEVDDWRAGQDPEAKRTALAELKRSHGMVAMVGDGMNDGPVLAAADVGIALGSASDLAQEAADVVLPGGGLVDLPWLLELSRLVRRVTLENFAWALGYNLVALGMAATGHLQPVLAAALMAGSSVLVVCNSLRLERHQPGTAQAQISAGCSRAASSPHERTPSY